MNILYINHYAGGPAFGMEYRPHYLAREWVRAGHAVTVIGASYSHLRKHQPDMSESYTEQEIDGVRYVWCRTPTYSGNGIGRVINIFAFMWRLLWMKEDIYRNANVVVASSTYPLDIFPARRMSRKAKCQLIWEVHDLWPLSPMELGGLSRWHPFTMLLQWAEDSACRVATKVISMLPKANLHLEQRGMAPEKFFYIPNGIDPDEWMQPALPAPNQYRELVDNLHGQGHTVIGYAGGHAVSNALDVLLDAAILTCDDAISWVLIGDGAEKERLEKRVVDENIKNIFMMPSIPKAEIPETLKLFDALYLGYRKYNLYRYGIGSNKILDYMMAGRPVILGADTGSNPVMEAGCGIVIAPDDPKALAQAACDMARLLVDERLSLGQKGTDFVTQNHRYPVLAQKFIDVLAGGSRV